MVDAMTTKNASLLSVLMPLLLAACNVTFIEGATEDGGANEPVEPTGESSANDPGEPPDESGSVDPVGSGGSGGGAALTAVALTRAQMDVLWEQYWESRGDITGSSGSGGPAPELDPNDLFLRASDLGVSCGSPTTDLSCGGHWQVHIVLPTAYQQVGVYDLNDSVIGLYSSMSETGQPYSPQPDDCPWGGGSFGPGTLEILAIDSAEVRFRLTMGSLWESDPSGEYTAPRCP
jgi:hypothetical protein